MIGKSVATITNRIIWQLIFIFYSLIGINCLSFCVLNTFLQFFSPASQSATPFAKITTYSYTIPNDRQMTPIFVLITGVSIILQNRSPILSTTLSGSTQSTHHLQSRSNPLNGNRWCHQTTPHLAQWSNLINSVSIFKVSW